MSNTNINSIAPTPLRHNRTINCIAPPQYVTPQSNLLPHSTTSEQFQTLIASQHYVTIAPSIEIPHPTKSKRDHPINCTTRLCQKSSNHFIAPLQYVKIAPSTVLPHPTTSKYHHPFYFPYPLGHNSSIHSIATPYYVTTTSTLLLLPSRSK